MKNSKRVVIATLSGLISGFICYSLASSGGSQLAQPIILQIISSRVLMGFAIGISCLGNMPWFVHGPLLGGLFSLPLSFSGMIVEVPGFTKTSMFISTMVMGLIYGFLIELITSVFFKARVKE